MQNIWIQNRLAYSKKVSKILDYFDIHKWDVGWAGSINSKYIDLKLVFGKINLISFGLVTGLGYLMLSFLQVYSKRIVHRIHIQNDFETVHVEFYNAFWVIIYLLRNLKVKNSIFHSFKSLSLALLILLVLS